MASANTVVNPQLSSPRWLAEPSERKAYARFPAKVVAASFTDKDAVSVVLTANASSSATSITITAITLPNGITKIPLGTVLYFGGQKVATLTADYTSGTTMSVAALPTALVSTDTATVKTYGNRVAIPSGTLVGRTLTERAASTGFGPWASGDDEVYLTMFDVEDAATMNDVTLVENLVTIKENYLPNFTTLSTTVAEVQTVVNTGTLSAGTFSFYDSRSGEVSTPVAYNGNLAAIQAALDELYGATNSVAAGTMASFTITFAVALAAVDMPLIEVRADGVTGYTGSNVSQTRAGGSLWLAKLREKYRTIRGVN